MVNKIIQRIKDVLIIHPEWNILLKNPVRFSEHATCLTIQTKGYGCCFFLGRFHWIYPRIESILIPTDTKINIHIYGFMKREVKTIFIPSTSLRKAQTVVPTAHIQIPVRPVKHPSFQTPKIKKGTYSIPKINFTAQISSISLAEYIQEKQDD